jgi:hypothetical protein
MLRYFDRAFFRFLFGFLFILAMSFATLYFLMEYDLVSDPRASEARATFAQNVTP